MKQFLFSLLFTLISLTGFSQGFDFQVQVPSVVEQGRTFGVSFSTNQKVDRIDYPDFKGFSIVGGPSVSSSSSVSISNGNIVRQANYTYTYYLQATKAGQFTIGQASTKYDGKVYQTPSKLIKVAASNGSARKNTQTRGRTKTNSSAPTNSEELFVDVILNKTSVYQNEPILATIKLYSLVQISGSESVSFPSFDGFWSQELKIPDPRLENERYNGRIYQTAIFKKVLLYPQKSGKLSIEPAEMSFKVRQRVSRGGGFFDDFFGNYQNISRKVKSKKKTITVKPLPSNKPLEFTGAVGDLRLKSSLSKTKLKSNESINLTVEISGKGNMKLVEPLDFQFPEDFEVYDPKTTENLKTTESGMQGSVKHEYLLIPRHSGKYTIPKAKFVFFNPKTKKFKTLYTKEFTVDVEKSEGESVSNYQPASGLQKEDIKQLDSDIRFIKTNVKSQVRTKTGFIISKFDYFLYYVILLASFFIIYFIRRKKIEDSKDVVRVKNKGAKKLVRKRLKSVQIHIKENNKNQFYNELLRALWGYVGDKFNIPIASVNRDSITGIFEENGIAPEITSAFIQLADDCEFAHFAPSTGEVHDEIQAKYKLAEDLIIKIEQNTK